MCIGNVHILCSGINGSWFLGLIQPDNRQSDNSATNKSKCMFIPIFIWETYRQFNHSLVFSQWWISVDPIWPYAIHVWMYRMLVCFHCQVPALIPVQSVRHFQWFSLKISQIIGNTSSLRQKNKRTFHLQQSVVICLYPICIWWPQQTSVHWGKGN